MDGVFRWTASPDVRASDLLRPDSDSDERSAKDEAMAWLQSVLRSGPLASEQVQVRAERELGISRRTLRRAKKELGVLAEALHGDHGKVEAWLWKLPENQVANPGHVAKNENPGHVVKTAQPSDERPDSPNQVAKGLDWPSGSGGGGDDPPLAESFENV